MSDDRRSPNGDDPLSERPAIGGDFPISTVVGNLKAEKAKIAIAARVGPGNFPSPCLVPLYVANGLLCPPSIDA